MRCSAGPSASVSAVRKSTPAPAPMSAGRPRRVVPTASTIVSASTNSTSDARKAATMTVPTCVQLIAPRRAEPRAPRPPRPPPRAIAPRAGRTPSGHERRRRGRAPGPTRPSGRTRAGTLPMPPRDGRCSGGCARPGASARPGAAHYPSRPRPGRRSPTALPRPRATPSRRRRSSPPRRHLDRRHHALVLLRQELAVIHEPADDDRTGGEDAHRDCAVHRDVDDVLVPVEPLWHAVHLRHLEVRLVDVKIMQLAGFVPNGPLLHRTEPDARIGAAGVERPAVDEERVPVLSLGKHDGAAARDCAP